MMKKIMYGTGPGWTSGPVPIRVEVVRETDHNVWTSDGEQHAKRTNMKKLWDTWEEALEHQMQHVGDKIARLSAQYSAAYDELTELRKAKRPQ